jgi:hypothetical protein
MKEMKKDGVRTSTVVLGIIVGILSVACVFLFFTSAILFLALWVDTTGLLHVTYFDWGPNENNENELLFQPTVANFGYIEATEVEVTCEVYETDEDGFAVSDYPVLTTSGEIGNVASTSTKITELTYDVSNTYVDTNKTMAVCYVSSCADCEILIDRLPPE